ncbi:MAG: phenylalanine--tRNA ligase subunit beta [Candidatus Omnitrophica bacterium]|nr:phenylalanine--tRNA ligase subunit beta [Candidatus Omnitrophota bacterium]
MKLPISWLKEYIDVSVSPERLAELLTLSGTAVERIEKKGGEAVLDIEVTTNRPDCLSILGLAREVSALTGERIKKVVSSQKSVVSEKIKPKSLSPVYCPPSTDYRFTIRIEDKKGCPLYTARLIQNVTIGPAPSTVQRNLELVGSRPINNVVDATNFVLFEMGQPLHAFDADKIEGGVVVARSARKGEKFLPIDGPELTLDEKTLVIADAQKVIAIAGVMGGKRTEVTASTKNILLESAYFDPARVRQASRLAKISTESSYRFERGVDPSQVAAASRRAATLIGQWAGGSDQGMAEKIAGSLPKPPRVFLRPSRLEKVLGQAVPAGKILKTLQNLGFSPVKKSADRIAVPGRSGRRDIRLEADLIEEILRIEGFDTIQPTIPVTKHGLENIENKKIKQIQELKKYLAALGLHEIITYSLLPGRLIRADLPGGVSRLRNPASAEQEYLRSSLLPGMLQTIAFNINRKADALKLFEIGNCYKAEKESTRLAMALYGHWEKNWKRKSEASFYDLKGVVENILGHLKIDPTHWPSLIDGKLMRIEPTVTKFFDIPNDVYYFEINWDELTNDSIRKKLSVETPHRFPSVRRDIAFIVDKGKSVGELSILIKSTSPYLEEVLLLDEYVGKNIPAGRRSLAFSLVYQKETGTFTDAEITALQNKVGDALRASYKVEFR